MVILRSLFTILLLWLIISSYSQNVQIWDIEEYSELPENTGNVLFSDNNGFVWIGTQGGLARFNGTDFKLYDNLNDHKLSNNMIESIYQDREGYLWVGTRRGLNKINLQTDSIMQFFPEDTEGNDDYFIRYGMYDDGTNLWFRTNKNTYKLNKKSHQLIRLTSFTKTSGGSLFSNEGTIYFSSDNILYRIDNDKVILHKKFPAVINRIQSIDDEIIVATAKGAYKLNGEYYLPQVLQDRFILYILEGSKKDIWVGTLTGLIHFSKGKARTIIGDNTDLNEFGKLQLDGLVDAHSDIWIGTSSGIGVVYSHSQSIHQIRNNDGSTIPNKTTVRCMAYDSLNESIAVATESGLIIMNQIGSSESNWEVNRNYLVGEEIIYVNTIKSGEYWVGSADGKVFNISGNKVREMDNNSYQFLGVRGFIESNGLIWMATSNGVFFIDSNYRVQQPPWLSTIDYSIGLFNFQERLVFSHNQGLYEIDYEHGQIIPFHIPNLSSSMVTDIQKFNDEYYLATISGGISVLDKNLKVKDTLLPGRNVWFTGIDEQKRLWCSTDNGLFLVTDSRIYQLNEKDGLKDADLNMHTSVLLGNGTLVVGSSKILSAIATSSYKPSQRIGELFIKDLQVDYQAGTQWDHSRNLLELDPDEEVIKIEFMTNGYLKAEFYSYSFKLLGLNDKWSPNLSLDQPLMFNSLPHGKYELQVKAANGDEMESGILTLGIVVNPHFYETGWFKILIALSVGIIISFAFGYRSRRLKQLAEQRLRTQEAVASERERIARDLHDSLGAGLSKIASDLDILELRIEQGNDQNFSSEISKTRDYTSQTINTLRQSIWTLDGKELSIRELVHQIDRFAKDHIPSHISYHVSVDDSVLAIILSPKYAVNLLRATQEIIHNMIKYSEAKNFNLSFKLANKKQLCVVMIDDGIGFSNKEKIGKGITYLHQRAREINAKLEIETMQGVKYTWHIPV